MKEIQLIIKALSPLAIGRQKPGGSISEAQTYIPGSVIRGAIAAQILQQASADNDQPGGDFQTLFLDEDAAIFSNAYPTTKNEHGQALPVQVLPSTAVSSKTNPGFCTEKSRNHGVFDTLIDRFCAEGYGHPYDPNCPKDGGRIEPYSGFYSFDGEKYQSHSVETRLLTRVGINRRRATAQEQVLYSIEVINETRKKGKEDAIFSSTIHLEDADLAELLAEYIQSSSLRLGGSVSRGLGKVSIETSVNDYQPEVYERVEAFNEKLKKRWKTWSIFNPAQEPLTEDRKYFTLDLQSDAIFTEQWRRTTVISPAMLRQMAGVDDPDLVLHAAYSSYDYCSGWNSAWGLMKDVELVTNKGSVYLFSTLRSKFDDQWLPALKRLEFKGVGERTPEGFGQVQVCSEFHQVFREEPA